MLRREAIKILDSASEELDHYIKLVIQSITKSLVKSVNLMEEVKFKSELRYTSWNALHQLLQRMET